MRTWLSPQLPTRKALNIVDRICPHEDWPVLRNLIRPSTRLSSFTTALQISRDTSRASMASHSSASIHNNGSANGSPFANATIQTQQLNGYASHNNTSSKSPIEGSTEGHDNGNSTKRKRSGKPDTPKFYAVRVGKIPGIYQSWTACLEQVKGFPKANFKSFPSKAEAEAYMGDGTVSSGGGGSNGNKGGPVTRWYGVQNGKNPGVYTTWEEVLEQIKGSKNPKHRGFKTQAEAEAYVAEGHMKKMQMNGEYDLGDGWDEDDAPVNKKSKKSSSKRDNDLTSLFESSDFGPGNAPFPPDTEDGFDSSIMLDPLTGEIRYKTEAELQAYKPFVSRPVAASIIRIYTDGSSLGNGQSGACGGIGVYFGPGDRRNVSEALPGTRQTNQRAELTAIMRALEVAPRDRKCIIYSDSHYSIKCCTEWFVKWRQNGWLNSSGKPVENKDLISKIIDMLEERWKINKHRVGGVEDVEEREGDGSTWERGPASVNFEWVKGHDKDAGNNAADRLAVAGAREARELGGEV
ncbi:ribonuclease H-like protein [Polychaeton citri CBS 116435]|uniref:Ribonuclease H n=1 Tax=Polychaeton citri CBS 116435 TaxID=1314669 RepID=A0A9P4UM35_9PEZI|nr:ribonuclease H-like protein [Polychaeton citri CBS 116435]